MDTTKKIIDEITGINQTIGAPDLTKPVLSLMKNHDKTIFLAVLGQFKSGKSSLVNSILGENLLPVGVVPVTAIVTRLRFGNQPRLIVQYSNGKETTADVADLPNYVTEKLNPENIKNIDQVIVEHPNLQVFQNISLVDTPGLGSFYKHNSQTTLHWLPFTGIALISISAERPLSEEDIMLLKGIAYFCPEIAVVVTKTDLFTREQLDEIKQHISQSVNQALGKEIPVFEYSIIKNEDQHRRILIKKMVLPFNSQPESKLAEIIHYKIKNIIEQSLSYSELALQAAIKKEASVNAVKKFLDDIRNNRKHYEREMLLSGTAFKGEIRDKLENLIMPNYAALYQKLTHDFDLEYPLWKGSLFSVSRHYEKWLKEKTEIEITAINNQIFDHVNHIAAEITGYYQYTALRFRQLLNEKLNHELGVQLPESYWQIDFTGVERPDISVYRAFDSHIDTLLFFLPMQWFRGIFYRHFYNQIAIEVEKNLQRYISDLNGKMIKTIDIIYKQALQYMINEISTVENILQQSNNNVGLLQSYYERLKELRQSEYYI